MAQPQLQYKSVNATGIKTIDEEQGIVECFVAGIGNKDSVGDIIEKGAFVDSITKRAPKGVWSHDWDRPVSKTLDIYEVNAGDDRLPQKMKDAGIGGLYVKTQFNLETQDGRDALSWVKFFGAESEWSIGYTAEAEYDRKAKATRLKKIELYEYSPVLFGANPLTSTVGVKVHFGTDDDGNVSVDIFGVDDEAIQSAARKAVMDVIAKTDEKDTPTEDVEFEIEGVDPVEVKSVVEDALAEGVSDEADKVDSEEETDAKEASEDLDNKSPEEDVEETKTVEEEETDTAPEAQTGGSEEKSADDGDVEAKDAEEAETPAEESIFVQGVKNFLSSATLTAEESQSLKSFIDEHSEKVGIPGSFEERRGLLEDALRDEVGTYAYIVATFESSIVYETYDMEKDAYATYERSYSSLDGGYAFGDAAEVEIVPVIVAKTAIIDAIFKGYGPQISNILAPFIEGAKSDAPDTDVKSALEDVASKAGASLSTKNRNHLETAMSAIQSVLGTQEDTDEKALEAKDESANEEKASDIPDEDVDAPLWYIEQKDNGYCVYEQDSKTEVGCHEFLEGAEAQVYELADALKSLVDGEKSDEPEEEEKSEKVVLNADEYKQLMEILNDEE